MLRTLEQDLSSLMNRFKELCKTIKTKRVIVSLRNRIGFRTQTRNNGPNSALYIVNRYYFLKI